MTDWLTEYAAPGYGDQVAVGVLDLDHRDVLPPSAIFQPHILERAASLARENGMERVGLQLIPAPHPDGDESHILVLRNEYEGELAVVAAPVVPSEDDEQQGVGEDG